MVWKVRGYTHPQGRAELLREDDSYSCGCGENQRHVQGICTRNRLLSSGTAWAPTGDRSPLVPARHLSWVRSLVKEGIGNVHGGPGWGKSLPGQGDGLKSSVPCGAASPAVPGIAA